MKALNEMTATECRTQSRVHHRLASWADMATGGALVFMGNALFHGSWGWLAFDCGMGVATWWNSRIAKRRAFNFESEAQRKERTRPFSEFYHRERDPR